MQLLLDTRAGFQVDDGGVGVVAGVDDSEDVNNGVKPNEPEVDFSHDSFSELGIMFRVCVLDVGLILPE